MSSQSVLRLSPVYGHRFLGAGRRRNSGLISAFMTPCILSLLRQSRERESFCGKKFPPAYPYFGYVILSSKRHKHSERRINSASS